MGDKTNKDGLDADFLISQASKRNRDLKPYDPKPQPESAVEESPPEGVPAAPKEESRRRKSKTTDYESLFFKEAQIKTRSGSVVYIRKEYHKRMMKIVRIIGEDDVSLFSYLDNVLKHHFDMFQDDIARLYKEKNTDEYLDQ